MNTGCEFLILQALFKSFSFARQCHPDPELLALRQKKRFGNPNAGKIPLRLAAGAADRRAGGFKLSFGPRMTADWSSGNRFGGTRIAHGRLSLASSQSERLFGWSKNARWQRETSHGDSGRGVAAAGKSFGDLQLERGHPEPGFGRLESDVREPETAYGWLRRNRNKRQGGNEHDTLQA